MDHVCLWCGTELSPWFNGLYCSDSHREAQRRHRRKWADIPVVTCPKPYKVAYTHRGLVLRKAIEFGQRPYICDCGIWHLTSKPRAWDGNIYDEPLRRLAEEMSVMAVSA